ncbi:MAG: hypothetical protein QME81_19225 [bacterium]|nr:hypothetical protein [bacterium]
MGCSEADANRDREASDYSDYVEFTYEEAEAQLAQAKEFIRQTREVMEKVLSGNISLPEIK